MKQGVFLLVTAALAFCAASVCLAQDAAAEAPTNFLAASGLEFRLIEPGVFMMGNDATVEELIAKYPGGQPRSLALSVRRRVTLTQWFYMGARPVTVGDFGRFVAATGYKTTAEQKNSGRGMDAKGAWVDMPGLNWQEPGFAQTSKSPVVCVSYYDAVAYVNWLNATAAHEVALGGVPRYILPTEAQWEYACRAGTTTEFFWGDDAADGVKYLNAADESGGATGWKWSSAFPFNDGYFATSPVGSFEPNAWGLYDMLGNVWEWCSDRFGAYAPDPVVDPQGALLGEYRVLRGGGWDAAPALARCAYRGANLPEACNANYGFRVAIIPPEPFIAPTLVQPPVVPAQPVAPAQPVVPAPQVEEPESVAAQEPPTPAQDPASPEDELKQRVTLLGLQVLEGQRLIGDQSVLRAVESIETADYLAASQALKSGEPLDEVLLKKIKLTALLAELGSSLDESTVPNFELLPSVAQERVTLLGGLAFLGVELLREEATEPADANESGEE